ncbi:unnamed protein product [Rotaria sp. Silwood2]|nr:unnamed protein product [Rotaria sp. Silwood2]CAF4313229.1 unnamed protein product [Rotaria sp. Silwood2]
MHDSPVALIEEVEEVYAADSAAESTGATAVTKKLQKPRHTSKKNGGSLSSKNKNGSTVKGSSSSEEAGAKNFGCKFPAFDAREKHYQSRLLRLLTEVLVRVHRDDEDDWTSESSDFPEFK